MHKKVSKKWYKSKFFFIQPTQEWEQNDLWIAIVTFQQTLTLNVDLWWFWDIISSITTWYRICLEVRICNQHCSLLLQHSWHHHREIEHGLRFFPCLLPYFDRTFRLNIISSQLVIIRQTATLHRPTSPRSIGICKVPPVKTRMMKEVSINFLHENYPVSNIFLNFADGSFAYARWPVRSLLTHQMSWFVRLWLLRVTN